MKRNMAILAALSLFIFTFAACSMTNTPDNQAAGTEDPGNSLVEDMVTEAAEMGKDVKEMMTGEEENIGMEEAKSIALKDAGKSEEDVTFVSTEQKREGGSLFHVIEFRDDKEEYRYEIDASDGSIKSGKNDNH